MEVLESRFTNAHQSFPLRIRYAQFDRDPGKFAAVTNPTPDHYRKEAPKLSKTFRLLAATALAVTLAATSACSDTRKDDTAGGGDSG
ncbi:hypothetical protein, partial [Dactylosporangium sp. NPDC049140]|uniref:hypothetical protein n=1 Tax=Dactylosporangium sp. NPDC049140 TaxID=3155647 RepID=UPI0033E1DB91